MWRIQAQHETVCPRCRGYIKKGVWIVQEPGQKRWSHAVCLADLRRAAALPAEPTVVTEWRPVFDKDGKHVGMEEINVASQG
jgi:hypothetical protein